MKVNYSIPVTLFDYRESENSLYSYAKLKIFYVGMTGDKRLFTQEFSDKLMASLPYVPVVGYYDEEEEDFKGHNLSVQYIYGIVPEDTTMDYIEEDGKKYAICDVILYTGRRDRTGEIAQEIVGKSHSLELNPADTKYKINKLSNGQIKSIEFTEGTLLGLSVLGDNEKPAFAGSEFFNMQSEFMKMFADFRMKLEEFTKNNQRGDEMSVELENTATAGTEVDATTLAGGATTTTEEFSITTEEATAVTEETPSDSQTNETDENFDSNENEENENEENDENLNHEENEEDENTEDTPTREERFMEAFMKVTYDEIQEEVLSAFYSAFGDYVFVVQWSPFDNVLVYFDIEDYKYHRVTFTQEEENISFSEPVLVKPRFLTEEEINSVFTESNEEEDNFSDTEEGTENEQEDNSSTTEGENFNEENNQEEQQEEESQEEFTQTALNKSEREELEGYRREAKIKLVGSFEEDLSKDFIQDLLDKVDEFVLDELDVVLSKEFTRVTKENKTTKPNTFIYNGNNEHKGPETEAEIVQRLVNRYKTNN